ncbi:hypothetical protein [Xanthomonas cannabis]|uniref:hypothetical protein n=1 Tax=Xanthomonas cannabis TaxID=1885674 RepID=UPI0033A2F6F9
MSTDRNREFWLSSIQSLENDLAHARDRLAEYDEAPERFQFDTVEDASGVLGDVLWSRAHADCEGSYNCGDDEYRQECYVQGVKHVAIFTADYNRHDKTYYYIDFWNCRVEVV